MTKQAAIGHSAIIKWLKDNGKSQSWLASKLDISRQSVHAWITGKARPSIEYAHEIVKLAEGTLTLAEVLPVPIRAGR